ncbi:MAG: hypothetical protein B7X99_18690 [Rhizobiales bacterium 17-65-6]|nr:MAG: hypothetical protein B7X99_18690 [Rhizobiales bacterium 17-65-6]
MAIQPRRASARTPVETFPDSHKRLRRRVRRTKTVTQRAAEDAFELISALSVHFQPVALVPGGTAFLVVLPQHMIDWLAALGAALDDREPDAGEEPEEDNSDRESDAGDEPEIDHADFGLADADALNLWMQERAGLEFFWNARERNRSAIDAVKAQVAVIPRRRSVSQHVREV